jgi:hypothetical protein
VAGFDLAPRRPAQDRVHHGVTTVRVAWGAERVRRNRRLGARPRARLGQGSHGTSLDVAPDNELPVWAGHVLRQADLPPSSCLTSGMSASHRARRSPSGTCKRGKDDEPASAFATAAGRSNRNTALSCSVPDAAVHTGRGSTPEVGRGAVCHAYRSDAGSRRRRCGSIDHSGWPAGPRFGALPSTHRDDPSIYGRSCAERNGPEDYGVSGTASASRRCRRDRALNGEGG